MEHSKKLVTLHDNARAQFGRIQDAVRDERKQALEDRRFCTIPGAQWEGPLGEQYANRPKFEVNKVHLSVIRIINEYRNNRITVDFMPRKNGEDEIADLCDSMYRADEQDSEAVEAYDNAFEEAVMGGMGAFRLRADYEDEYDEENEHQRIKIEPIYDADISVYFDLDAKRQDKADAKYCFVVSSMTPEDYEDTFDDSPDTWPQDIIEDSDDWAKPDVVYVAEYYVVEEKAETKVYFETITGEEECYWLKDLEDEKLEELMAIGHEETRRRKIKRRKVHKYIMSGGGILEDCGHIAGKEIPVVPVYGKRWFIENVERSMGHVRLAKDAQRLKNMQLSKLGEISALSSVEKPILTPEQIAGNQEMWAEDNIKDYPYLLINPLTNEEGVTVAQGPIAYTKPSSVPPALAALLAITEEDMKDILGHYERGEELQSHMSGKAVEAVQTRIDMQTFIYLSNFSKGMRRCGEIWLSMAKDIYIEDDRDVKVVDTDGKSTSKKIRVKGISEEGEMIVKNNLEDANLDVFVDVGPSSTSKRAAIVREITGMIQYAQDPMTQKLLTSMALMNMEGEGLGDIREYFRKDIVKMGVGKPTQRDMEEMQLNPDQPSPNDQYLMAESERATAEAAKNRADTVETIANAELKRAQAEKIKAELAQLGMPVQQGQPAPDYEGGKLSLETEKFTLEAEKTQAELEIKARELEIKEQQNAIKFMEMMRRDEPKEEKEEKPDRMEPLVSSMSEAVQALRSSVDSNSERMKAATEAVGRPKKVIRENGRIVGIETE